MSNPVTIGVSERVLERAQQQGAPASAGVTATGAPAAVRVHPTDDVAVATRPLAAGDVVEYLASLRKAGR